jgi:menaquinol-cytochrome c reductase iron-sulfur subunit
MNDQGPSRRNFMVRAIVGIFVFIGAVLAIPFGGFGILPALRREKPEWSDVGTITDLPVDEPEQRRFLQIVKSGWQEQKQERSIWIVKRADGTVTAYSPNCPHLGCGYRWFSVDKEFKCPCHGSVFDINGKVLAGPAPRPLDTLPAKVDNGKLLVQYEVFQLGISKKELA